MLASARRCATSKLQGTTAEPDWQNLRDRFLEASAAAGEQAGGWISVWRLMVEHPWYRAELAVAAQAAVRRVGGPDVWQEDVAQDVILLLARKLRRDPRLGLDPLRAERRFAGWLARILRNDCRQAVRRLRRLARGGELPHELPERTGGADREALIDLSLAIERLPEPSRTVLLLYAEGLALREIGERLKLSYWRAWRIWRDGCDRLRGMLS